MESKAATTVSLSRYRLARAVADIHSRAGEIATTGRCLFCPDVLFVGSEPVVVAQQIAHREAVHPGALERLNAARRAAKP